MKYSILFFLILIFISFHDKVIAADCDTDCRKSCTTSVRYPCGIGRWCDRDVLNSLCNSRCNTERTLDCERKKFRKKVKKAEKVLNDSKRAYRKAQKYVKKYRSIKVPKFPADSLKNTDPSRFVSGTYDAWKGYLRALEKAGIPAGELNNMFGGKYTSNKSNKMRGVERGGWIVAWGREINERDAGDGVVAAGVSIFSGGSSAYMWAQRLVMESIEKMGRSMRDAGNRLGNEARDRVTRVAKKVISDALRAKMPKSDSLNFGNLQAKAGLVKYSGTNSFKLPGGNEKTLSKTWGFIPYVAVKITTPKTIQNEKSKCYKLGIQSGKGSADIFCAVFDITGKSVKIDNIDPINLSCPMKHFTIGCKKSFSESVKKKCFKALNSSSGYKKYRRTVCYDH